MELFGSQNRKRCRKSSKKHYLHNVFVTRFQNVKIPYKTNGKWSFPESKKAVQNTLKTCRLWRGLGPFSENAMQKHAKSITVIDKSDRHFSTFAKREKPL